MNHPNRSRRTTHPARHPTPDEIKRVRDRARLTQTAAAALVYTTLSGWQRWEAGERQMHPGLWELFRAKVATL